MDAVVRFEKVSKRFGRQIVLDELDLELHRGEIIFILGRSGAGKSVMLKHIIGLILPDSGRIFVDDEDITSLDRRGIGQVRAKFGMLFQDAALFDSMNVFENVAFPLREHTRLSKVEIHKTVRDKLEQVGLFDIEEKLPAELSGGMRKRVGLARAIALDPQIILYDEPTTGLDPLMVDQIDELIVHTQKSQGATSIVISHDVPTALRIADRIAILSDGKIIAQGSPAEIRNDDHPFVRDFLLAAGANSCS